MRHVLLLFLACAGSAHAGFYDVEMGLDQRKGLPPLEAILAGKFERHSDAYYDAVILEQRERAKAVYVPGKPILLPNALTFAPALARRGQLDEAYDAIHPERNGAAIKSPLELATRASIQLARGKFDDAIAELTQANQQNPNRSFARDKYELELARYLQSVHNHPSITEHQPTFVRQLFRHEREARVPASEGNGDDPLFSHPMASNAVIDEAVVALSAMIRFGDLQAPHVYAALGDLLRLRGELPLAYRAYRRAIEANHPWRGRIERELEETRTQLGPSHTEIDTHIDAERRDAEVWVNAFLAQEAKVLQSGQTHIKPEHLESFYAEYGNLREPPITLWSRTSAIVARAWPVLSATVALLIVLLLMLLRRLRQAHGTAETTAAD